jgi:hypothetical protein
MFGRKIPEVSFEEAAAHYRACLLAHHYIVDFTKGYTEFGTWKPRVRQVVQVIATSPEDAEDKAGVARDRWGHTEWAQVHSVTRLGRVMS